MFTQRNRSLLRPIALVMALALSVASCSVPGLSGDQDAPTQAPEVTAGQTELATAPAQEDKSTGSLPMKDGACANSLMPMEVGNQWVYVQYSGEGTAGVAEGEPTPVPEETFTWTVIDVQQDIATIRMESDQVGLNAEYTLQCDDGAILTFPTFTLELSLVGGGGGTVNINYDHSSGVFLPSTETLESNNWDHQWETEITISGDMTSEPIEGQTFEMVFEESPWIMNWTTDGEGDQAFESQRVAAGTFDRALKLNQQADMAFNMQLEGMGDLGAQFTSEANMWFVEGVGLIKTQSLTSSMSLNEMDMPLTEGLDLTSTMELKEFNQGVEVE